MNIKAMWTLVKSAASSWSDDYAPSMGAALAYYTVFSMAPLLLIVIAVAGLVFGQDAARGEIFGQLKGMVGSDGAAAVQSAVEAVNKPTQGIVATIIGFGILIVGATTVFGELQDSLDRIWRAPARQTSGLWNLLRARVLSFGMILGIGFLLMVSLVVSAMISALGNWWSPVFGGWVILATIVNLVVGFLLTASVFGLIYKLMPRVHIKWNDVIVGSVVTALLFTLGKYLIGLYIGKSSVASGFGAAGSLAVVLVWVYYSAQIFLLGAEFTWVYAHTFGSRKGAERPAALNAAPAVPTRGNEADAATASHGGPLVAGGTPVPVKPTPAQPGMEQPSPAKPPQAQRPARPMRPQPEPTFGRMASWNMAWKRVARPR